MSDSREPCEHDRIQSWHLEDGKPAWFWSYVYCRTKFVPITQAWEEKRQAVRRCFEIVNSFPATREGLLVVIKDEFPEAFK